MAVEQRRAGLKVEIPKDESPRLGRVGLIALVGFAIGAIWPTIANFKLVPSAPTQAAAPPGLGGEPVAASALPAVPPPSPALEPAAKAPAGPAVGELQVTSCRGQGGRKLETCDAIDFDRLARPRLQALGGCAGASRLSGVLSIGLELDFQKNAVVNVANGKSTSFRQSDTDALIDCAKSEFAEVKLDGVAHEHPEYTVFYRIDFSPSPVAEDEAEPAAEEVSVAPASGRATVSWDVALVRSAPSRDGKVVARILSGPRVVVTGRNADWYQIKYDAKGSQGWVYRTAIGM